MGPNPNHPAQHFLANHHGFRYSSGMTTSPIERAARAMYDTVNPEWEWDDPDAEPLRRMYRENAKAAILAIREPSQAMLMMGQHMPHDLAFPLMIDAALEEE